ncbi:MAG: cysteine desulfurase [Alphaproteobacteria bacterium]|nr:cysteine desulfurase [Alphaproteobacteria bacterium]
MIYLDYNASVPLRPCVKKAILETYDLEGNPSSPHFSGRKVRALIDEARKSLVRGIHGQRLVFTSGGTEANALALSGLGERPLVVSSIEHESVLKAQENPCIARVTTAGIVDLKYLEKLLSSFDTPGLLSLMLVNNETGVIQPLQDAVMIARKLGWKVHTDASQALGHIPLSFEELGVDMMTLSSHKCGGPTGIGALVLKEDLQLLPLIRGGGQEFGMRSGTLAAPLIVGFAAAALEALSEREEQTKRLRELQKKVEEALLMARVHGKESPRAAHVLCLGMPGVSSELQLMSFDLKGIAISMGSACSSGKTKESHVLRAMGLSSEDVQCAIRMSMGWKTSEDDIDNFIKVWNEIFLSQQMKEAS